MSKRFHANRFGTLAYQGEDVRYFFDLTCHHLAVMQASGNYYLMGFQDGSKARGEAPPVRFHRSPRYLEVTAADLPYLKKPEGEWEFRKWERGDSWVAYRSSPQSDTAWHGVVYGKEYGLTHVSTLNNFRWCKPREVDAFEVWWESKGCLLIGASHKRLSENGWEAALASK